MADFRTAMAFRGLIRDQWKSADELHALQQARLQKLIRHAYENFPFYKSRFDGNGIRPEEIRTSEDVKRLPLVTKGDLRQAISASSHIPESSVWASTSGSTGIPMRFPFSPRDYSRLNLTWLRPLLAHGISPYARTLEITGPHNIQLHPHWYQRLGLWRKKSISIFASEEKWIESLNAYRPDILWGYSGSLKLLAQFIAKNKISGFRPRWVVGVSDLIDPAGRELIQEVFQTKLIDLYGAAEAGCISWLCPVCEEYHINADHLVLEFAAAAIRADFNNPHEIYLTNLHSFAFPIIRYDIGDLGCPSSRTPTCGRGLPLMRIIEGRSDAVIRLASGRLLSPLFFFAVMKKIPGLAHWQVIQEERGQIRVNVVPNDARMFSSAQVQAVIHEAMGEPIRIDVGIVLSIPEAANGKQCAVLSGIHEER